MLYGVIVVIYVLVMLGVGYWCMKRTKTVGDFFLGGRTLGPWMSAFAFGTTYFSAVLFIGYAGKLGWGFGIHTLWIVLGNTLIGTILAWKLLAGRTREMTARLNAITMPEFLRARYGSTALQVVAALVVFIFLVPYSASVYMGLSYLFQVTVGLQYNEALIFLAVLTGVYLVMGGYFAVAISDFIRGIVEFVGVLILVYVLAQHWGGGFAAATRTMLNTPDYAPALGQIAPLGPQGLQFMVPGAITLVALVLITSFGPWALPQMVQKFYSIRSTADVNRALIIAGVFALFMSFGAYYSGALTHFAPFTIDAGKNILFDGGIIAAAKNGNPNWDVIIPHFITHSGINMILVLVIVLMVFSASMSSLSSLVLVSSSAIAVDIYGAFVNRDANQKRMMGLMRAMCIVFVAASLVIALLRPVYIVNLMIISWGTLAGVFLAPFLYGLFWKRTTRAGVFAGIIVGLASALTLFLLWGEPGVPLAGAITMFLPLIVVPVVSLLTPPPPAALVAKAFTDAEPERVEPEKATI